MSLTNSEISVRHRVQDLVSSVAAVAGSQPVQLGRDGRAAFRWNEGQGTLVFEHLDGDEDFLAHLDVAPVAETNRESWLLRLLEWNWTGRELGGAFFAIDSNARRVLLCHWFPTDLPQEHFPEHMRRFFSLAHALRDTLTSPEPATPRLQEPARRDFRILDRV
jgi:hypothetical protein